MSGSAPSGAGSDERSNNIWSLLPSFDPAIDNVREYIEKVKFIDGICPERDRPMLAPRLAMLCRGTAWGQVKALEASALTDKVNGVKNLLQALASWEESSEMKTYELFEKALYKTTQKNDESTTSFVNRLQVAMDELGKVDVKQFHAFLLLRQSALTIEDRKRVLTMTSGEMKTDRVEQAMRTLATSVLASANEPKKKVYPTNYVEPETELEASSANAAPIYNVVYEDDDLDPEMVEGLANQGDSDALNVMSFERDLEDLFQEVPELQSALVSYQEARAKILDKKKHRGFWGSNSKGKNKSSFGKGFRKGTGKGGLLARIAKTNCKICGERGHWKAECPNRSSATTASDVNLAMHHGRQFAMPHNETENAQVIFEELSDPDAMHFAAQWEAWEKPEDKWGKWGNWEDRITGDSKPGLHPCLSETMDTPVHEAFFLQECHESVRKFFSQRFANRKSPRMTPKTSENLECLHSNLDMESIKHAGLAILDTGASRSVVGQDILPHVLKSSPPALQKQVREKPSQVGFRFGNNHVTYSTKQVQIPIFTATHKIWIVVEVVPDATPFLLSIQAMKMLGEAMKMIKNTAEAIMESLRLLLVILMSQLEVRAPEQEIALDHAQVLSSLLNEVQSQKDRIEQLSRMLQGRTLSGSPRKAKVPGSNRNFDLGDLSDQSWDLEEMEPEAVMEPNVNQRGASRPASTTTTTSARPKISKPATAATSPSVNPPMNLNAIPTQESTIALTAQALEGWGNKRVSWGKTHNGSRFAEVYEGFPSYVSWISARANSANAAMQDFIMYAQAREALERQALRAAS
eukprot:s1565_g4.t1